MKKQEVQMDAEKKRKQKHALDVANGKRCANEWHHLYSRTLIQKRLNESTLDDILKISSHSDVMTELHKNISSEPRDETELNRHIQHMARMAIRRDDGLKLENDSFQHFCNHMTFRHYSTKISSLCSSPPSLSVRLGSSQSDGVHPIRGEPPPNCIMDNCSFFFALSTIPPSDMDYHGDDLCGENIESFLRSLTRDIIISYDARDRISQLQRMLTQLNMCINLRRFSLTIHHYLLWENKHELHKLPPAVQQLLNYYARNEIVRRAAGDSAQLCRNHKKTIEVYAQCRQLIAMMMEDPCASMPRIKRLESKSHHEQKHVLMVVFEDDKEIPLKVFIRQPLPRAHCPSSRVQEVQQHASPTRRTPSGWDVLPHKKAGSTKKRFSKKSNTKKLRHKHKY